jgi:two-component system sensor histidine kinase TctE
VVASAAGDTLVVDVHDRGGADTPGAGIGLSIARGFAEVNGGSVELQPRPGGGMTARLVLPSGPLPAGVTS